MIHHLPVTKHCSKSKGIATFNYSVDLPVSYSDSTSSEVYIVGHYVGTSFRVDHKVTSLDEALSLRDSNSVILCAYFDLCRI